MNRTTQVFSRAVADPKKTIIDILMTKDLYTNYTAQSNAEKDKVIACFEHISRDAGVVLTMEEDNVIDFSTNGVYALDLLGYDMWVTDLMAVVNMDQFMGQSVQLDKEGEELPMSDEEAESIAR